MLLTLKFFEKQADFDMNLEESAVLASAGCGFVYTADKNAKITQIDHNKRVLSTESGLDQVNYLKAAHQSQDIVAASPSLGSYQLSLLNSSNLIENAPKPGQPFILQVKTKAKDACLATASQNLTFFAFSNSLNEIHIFKSPYSSKSKELAMIPFTQNITNLLITEEGIIYITTEKGVFMHSLVTKSTSQLDKDGIKAGFAFINSNGRLFVCRQKTIIYFGTNKVVHELDQVPSKVGPTGQYIYVAYNVQISTSFQVIDLEYGLLLNSQNIGSTVSFVDYQWGSLITINQEKNMKVFQEMKPQPKIDLLCKNLRFEMAVKMASQLQLGSQVEANIHALYGDYLFSQHNFSTAIEQYILTIGYVEPSHVIAKFVEPHHAEHLAEYLVKLPRRLISKQHTTLLFNCYTKIRATGKLDSIVKDFVDAAERNEEPSFDVETAVDVLKRNGYKQYALQLAKAFKQHSLFLKLLNEDEPDYASMLKYMKTIPGEEILSKLTLYGTEMMDNYEEGREELINFVVQCCIKGISNERKTGITKIDPTKLSSIFLNNDRCHFSFLYMVFKSDPSDLSPETWDLLIEITLRAEPEKVMELLSHPEAKYSQEQALIFMNAFNRTEGREFLYEKMKLYHLILQDSEPEKCLDICKKFGKEKPSLWSDALVKIAFSDCNPDIVTEFIVTVRENDIIPFLTILKVLQRSCKHKYKTILPIVQAAFKKEQDLYIASAEKLDNSKKKEEKSSKIIEHLSTKNFQVKRARCDICGQDIDFESRHFFCGHSFHENCMGDSTEFCFKCRAEYEEIASAKIERMKRARNNDDIKIDGDGFEFLLDEISNSLFDSGINMEQPDEKDDALNGPREFLRKLQY